MLREIAYVYRRKRIPWALSKERHGFQVNEVGASVIHVENWTIAAMSVMSTRNVIANFNNNMKVRQAQIDAFKNPTPAYHL